MANWRSITTDGVEVSGDGSTVQFGYDEPIGMPCLVTYLDADVQSDGDHWAVCAPGEDDIAGTFLVSRQLRRTFMIVPFRSYGQYSVKVNRAGHIAVVNDGGQSWTLLRGVRGDNIISCHRVDTYSHDIGSQGFAAFLDNNEPQWWAFGHWPVYGGLTFTRCVDLHAWSFGQDASHDDRLVAWHRPTQQLYEVTRIASQILPSGRQQTDGSLVVAVNLVNDAPLFFHSREFTPIVAGPPAPAPTPNPVPAPTPSPVPAPLPSPVSKETDMPMTDPQLTEFAHAAAQIPIDFFAQRGVSLNPDAMRAEAYAWAVRRTTEKAFNPTASEMAFKAATAAGHELLYRPQPAGQSDTRREWMDYVLDRGAEIDGRFLRRG